MLITFDYWRIDHHKAGPYPDQNPRGGGGGGVVLF